MDQSAPRFLNEDHATSIDSTSRRAWLARAWRATTLYAATSAGILAPALSHADSKNGNATNASLWNVELQQLDGTAQKLDMYQGKPLLLNFWATWCPPCIEEIPLLNAYHNKKPNNEWAIVGIAVDTSANVKRFMRNTDIAFDVVIAGSPGRKLSQTLGNSSGGIPYSVMLNSKGEVVETVSGLLSKSTLNKWLKTVK